jgi:hypothetical protein
MNAERKDKAEFRIRMAYIESAKCSMSVDVGNTVYSEDHVMRMLDRLTTGSRLVCTSYFYCSIVSTSYVKYYYSIYKKYNTYVIALIRYSDRIVTYSHPRDPGNPRITGQASRIRRI